MNFSDVTSWAIGPAYFRRQDNEQIYIIPIGSDKPLKVTFEDDSQDADWAVYGGPGNQQPYRWTHDDGYICSGVSYCRYPSVPQIDTATVEELL